MEIQFIQILRNVTRIQIIVMKGSFISVIITIQQQSHVYMLRQASIYFIWDEEK